MLLVLLFSIKRLQNVIFNEVKSTENGGAISLVNSSLALDRCSFFKCFSSRTGGAIYSSDNSMLTMSCNMFIECRCGSTSNDGSGSALFTSSTDIDMNRATIYLCGPPGTMADSCYIFYDGLNRLDGYNTTECCGNKGICSGMMARYTPGSFQRFVHVYNCSNEYAFGVWQGKALEARYLNIISCKVSGLIHTSSSQLTIVYGYFINNGVTSHHPATFIDCKSDINMGSGIEWVPGLTGHITFLACGSTPFTITPNNALALSLFLLVLMMLE